MEALLGEQSSRAVRDACACSEGDWRSFMRSQKIKEAYDHPENSGGSL